MVNYSCKQFSPMAYALRDVHLLYRRTTTMTTARPLLKYGWL